MIVVLIAFFSALCILILGYALVPQTGHTERRLMGLAGNTGLAARYILLCESTYSGNAKSEALKRLQEAGWYTTSPGLFAAYRVSSALGGLAIGLLSNIQLKGSGLGIMLPFILAFVGYVTPSVMLDNATKNRKQEVACQIPDFLDAVGSAVTAGVALNAAFISAVEVVPGTLGDEVRAALAEIRMGRSRADALTALSKRVNQIDLSQLITTIIQSEKVGGNIAQVLDELGAEARNRRFMRAEEIAATLPLKMTFPMALFLLPSIFVVVFTPVAALLAQK